MLQALEETQLLRVSSMSTALLIVFIDSATNLPVSDLDNVYIAENCLNFFLGLLARSTTK